MLLQLCKRTNQLAEKPEFYHTLAKSCTTSLIREANIVTPGKIPFSLGEIMPGYSIKPAIKFGVVQDLGNTRAVCRSSYIRPMIMDDWENKTFIDNWNSEKRR